jgi:L-iditol 2-dehydrogenase
VPYQRVCTSDIPYSTRTHIFNLRSHRPGNPLPRTLIGWKSNEGVLAEHRSVLIHAFRRAAFSASQTVLLYGVSTIGLLARALAKARGCSRVVAVDINQARLSLAKSHGFAQDVFCLPR